MISVPNPLQRLNGSNWIFLLLLLFGLSLSSCDLFKKLPDNDKVYDPDEETGEILGPKQRDPDTGEYQDILVLTETMDTLAWKDRPKDKFPPISSPDPSETAGNPNNPFPNNNTGTDDPQVGLKDVYQVSCFLPFYSSRLDTSSYMAPIYRGSDWAIQYYAGVKMAMDQLELEGAKIHFKVVDTEGSNSVLQRKLKNNRTLRESDLIIGPYKSLNARILASYAQSQKIPMVSPFSANTNVTANNPFYIQLNPSIQSHCEAISRHALSKYDLSQIVVVARNRPEELKLLSYFQEGLKEMVGNDTTRFQEFIIRDETADYRNVDVLPYVLADRPTVFIMASYSDESFVYSMLRKLKIASLNFSEVTAYGFPQWMGFDRIDFDLYEDLNVHVSSAFYLDDFDAEIKDFKQKFFDSYGTPPEEEAYIGYESTLYFGKLLQQYGNQFLRFLPSTDMANTYTTYNFREVYKTPGVIGDRPSGDQMSIERYENKFVQILQFKNYYFQLAE